MATIGELVVRLCPRGTRPTIRKDDWTQCPQWAPDAFAVAATLLERSGIYAADRYSGRSGGGLFGPRYRSDVKKAGKVWAKGIEPPPSVERDWQCLVTGWNDDLSDLMRKPGRWWDCVVRIFSSADEACAGAGFSAEHSNLANIVLVAYSKFANQSRRGSILPYLPRSLCRVVRPTEACVQPKSRTSQVGCTLRALSHHLALIPPVTEVRTAWYVSPTASESREPLNLLAVPFPYFIDGKAFVAGSRIQVRVSPIVSSQIAAS